MRGEAGCVIARPDPFFAGMRVDHGGRHIAVAEKLLHRADIGARLQQVGGKAVAQGVNRNRLANARLGDGLLDSPL